MFSCYQYGKIILTLENVLKNGGENTMKGQIETAETLKDGWLHTGDKGIWMKMDTFFINGRVKI